MISLTILTHGAAKPLLKKEGIKTRSRLFDITERKDIYVVNPSMELYIKTSNYESIFLHLFLLLLTARQSPSELVSDVEKLQINALLRVRIVSQLKQIIKNFRIDYIRCLV